jgi:hypothetical protein
MAEGGNRYLTKKFATAFKEDCNKKIRFRIFAKSFFKKKITKIFADTFRIKSLRKVAQIFAKYLRKCSFLRKFS